MQLSQLSLNDPPLLPVDTHLAKQQAFNSSCGAACLLCAAKELGVKEIPPLDGLLSSLSETHVLELNERCEMDIYRITSGSTTQRKICWDLTQAGYSTPEDIVTAGRVLGLQMRAVKIEGAISKAISHLYPEIEKNLKGMGCPIEHHPPQLNNKQISIEVMLVFSLYYRQLNLHWVLHRSDETYMNPQTGENYPHFDALNRSLQEALNDPFSHFFKTGIAVIAELP